MLPRRGSWRSCGAAGRRRSGAGSSTPSSRSRRRSSASPPTTARRRWSAATSSLPLSAARVCKPPVACGTRASQRSRGRALSGAPSASTPPYSCRFVVALIRRVPCARARPLPSAPRPSAPLRRDTHPDQVSAAADAGAGDPNPGGARPTRRPAHPAERRFAAKLPRRARWAVLTLCVLSVTYSSQLTLWACGGCRAAWGRRVGVAARAWLRPRPPAPQARRAGLSRGT
mmetsp:Transcript_37600/g.117816  ORF Transcript_37600/g.117816 Transcript_37600/m.117816 type:complete len:229 (-) Transcript_37600:164-850(-)